MKKIMFNDRYGLTETVLSGRKTMTRRIVPQSVTQKLTEYQLQYFDATLEAISEQEAINQIYFVERLAKLPYNVGEIVAIAQSYKNMGYDANALDRSPKDINIVRGLLGQSAGWNNKMFVRVDACKNHLRITNSGVERLQDISDEDCIKEGVEIVPSFVNLANGEEKRLDYYRVPIFCKSGRVLTLSGSTPREVFAALIDKVSGKGTWASNPFVFVYEFELVK